MNDTLPTREEIEFNRYQDFIAESLRVKRANIAPPLGESALAFTNLSLAPVTLGLFEASRPYAGEYEIQFPETADQKLELYTRILADIGLGKVIDFDANHESRQAALQHTAKQLDSLAA